MRASPLLLAGFLVIGCSSPAPRASTPAPKAVPRSAEFSAAEAVVQAQLEAYNRRDIEAFLASYAPEIRIYEHPDRLLMSGIQEMRERYGPMFEAAPDLHAAIGGRIVEGEYVIDHEIVTGFPGRPTVRAVAIYQVRDGLIQNVWFIG